MTLKTWTRQAAVLAAVAAAFGPAGCSGSSEKPVYRVHGRLTSGGQPMAKAEIAFLPADPSQRTLQSRATATADGEYELYTYRQGDGAPAGEYVVTLYWPGPLTKAQQEKLAKADTLEQQETIVAPDRLKNAYTDPRKTGLKATVGEKDNEIDFNLP